MTTSNFVNASSPNFFSGCLPRDDNLGDVFSVFEDSDIPLVPRSQWKDLLERNASLEPLVKKIKDQGQEGSCASNATTQALEIVWNLTLGSDNWLEMSAMSVYRWVGRSASSGSTISSNLRQLRDVGALPVDSAVNKTLLSAHGLDPSKTHPPRGYSKRFPTEWKETAKNFRALEWFDIASFEGIITALFMDFPVVYGRASHSICGVEPVYKNGTWNIKYANSWGEWGENGFGYDTEAFVSRAIRSYGAWCLRAIHIPEAFNAIPPLTT